MADEVWPWNKPVSYTRSAVDIEWFTQLDLIMYLQIIVCNFELKTDFDKQFVISEFQ